MIFLHNLTVYSTHIIHHYKSLSMCQNSDGRLLIHDAAILPIYYVVFVWSLEFCKLRQRDCCVVCIWVWLVGFILYM